MWQRLKKKAVMDEKVELCERGVDLKFNTFSLRRDGRLTPTLGGIDWTHCVEPCGFCGSDSSYSQIVWFVCHRSFYICQCLPLLHQKTLSWHCYPISSQCLSLYIDTWTLENCIFCVKEMRLLLRHHLVLSSLKKLYIGRFVHELKVFVYWK